MLAPVIAVMPKFGEMTVYPHAKALRIDPLHRQGQVAIVHGESGEPSRTYASYSPTLDTLEKRLASGKVDMDYLPRHIESTNPVLKQLRLSREFTLSATLHQTLMNTLNILLRPSPENDLSGEAATLVSSKPEIFEPLLAESAIDGFDVHLLPQKPEHQDWIRLTATAAEQAENLPDSPEKFTLQQTLAELQTKLGSQYTALTISYSI